MDIKLTETKYFYLKVINNYYLKYNIDVNANYYNKSNKDKKI